MPRSSASLRRPPSTKASSSAPVPREYSFSRPTSTTEQSTSSSPVTATGDFKDPKIPPGFAPFGIENIDGDLFVSYAKQNAEQHDDVSGPGNGFVDVFDTDGNLLRRFASRGPLNSPWGMTRASFD